MPCLLVILVLAFPRVVLALLLFLSNYVQRAVDNVVLIILGFLFLPLTTLAYAWIINSHHGPPTSGENLIILIIAVLIDLGGLGGGWRGRSR